MTNELENSTAKLQKQLQSLKGLTPHALLAGAFVLERYAKENAPVDTGFLRESIFSRQTEQGAEVVVGANYGFYQEFGSTHNAAQPYLRPAVDEHSEDIVKAVAIQIDKDLAEKLKGG